MKVDDVTTSVREAPFDERRDLLVLGGPLYQMYLRCRLARPPIELLTRRILALVCITWVPLAVLSAIEGSAVGGIAIPFFQHIGANVRFLVVLPLLIVAEVIVHQRIACAVEEFKGRGLLASQDESRFEDAVAGTLRLRNSVVAEVLLLILAFTVGSWLWQGHIAIRAPTWYGPGAGGAPLTIAGYWYAFVSLPILRFLIARWCFRVFVWYRFLWKVSRIRLRLNSLHPDRAGGLGFLENTPFAFTPVLLAWTALLAGELGDRIWHQGASLVQFKLDVAVVLVSLVLLVYLPLTFFVKSLYRAWWIGLHEYGAFAARYVNDFRDKWTREIDSKTPGSELGSGDIQSLADLANSFSVPHEMRFLPFAPKSVLRLAIVVALPLAPLVLTVIPLNEVISRLIKLIP